MGVRFLLGYIRGAADFCSKRACRSLPGLGLHARFSGNHGFETRGGRIPRNRGTLGDSREM